MQITNEEMEALNRASEILSKYAAQGGLSHEDFEHYERMVIAVIDEYGMKSRHFELEEKERLLCRLQTVLTFAKDQQLHRLLAATRNLMSKTE